MLIKNYLVVLVLVLAAFAGNSQQLIPFPNDSAEINDVSVDSFTASDIHIEIINNTVDSVTITWGLHNYQTPSSWQIALCDNNNCYDLLIGIPQHTSYPVGSGDTMDFKFQYTAHCITGTGNTNVYYYITGDSTNSLQHLNYKANLTANCPNGIVEKASVNNLKVYPNPIKNSFLVSGLENVGNLSLEVYDMKGAIVKTEVKNATNSEIEISIQTLSKGEYLLKVYDANGKIINTSRINKMD